MNYFKYDPSNGWWSEITAEEFIFGKACYFFHIESNDTWEIHTKDLVMRNIPTMGWVLRVLQSFFVQPKRFVEHFDGKKPWEDKK